MKRKKGFTLIELLAVIVILAIIALIATPMILGVIDSSKKGAFQSTAYGILDAAEYYYASHIADETFTPTVLDVKDEVLNYKGTRPNGTVLVTKEGKTKLSISNASWCAIKDLEESEVRILKNGEEGCVGSGDSSGSGSTPGSSEPTIAVADLKNLVVTEGSGLYEMDGRYVYRGSFPHNYLVFNDSLWRILAINSDGTVRIMSTTSGISPKNDPTLNISLLDDLNRYYYSNIVEKDQKFVVEADYGVQDVTSFSSAAELYQWENLSTQKYRIAILSLSDCYFGTTVDTMINSGGNFSINNWIYPYIEEAMDDSSSANRIWFLNKTISAHTFTIGRLTIINQSSLAAPYTYYPITTLANTTRLSGTGSQLDPYRISN